MNENILFSSENYPLKQNNCKNITQVYDTVIVKIANRTSNLKLSIDEKNEDRVDLIPKLGVLDGREKILEYNSHNLKRCKRCILTETMPFIEFDSKGVCNYCHGQNKVHRKKNILDLKKEIKKYRSHDGSPDCIVPFSGGRDSTFSLHFIKKVLKLKA